MSITIPVHFVPQYEATIRLLQQQNNSRFQMAVTGGGQVNGDRVFFDQVDSLGDMREVTNRHGDTEYDDIEHVRRSCPLTTFESADLVDRADVRRVLNNPTSAYSMSMAAAANRRKDVLIIAAFDAIAQTGVAGAGTVAFDTDFSFTSAAANLGFADLLTARELLEAQENEEDDGMNSWHISTSSSGRQALLNETEVTSADFNTVRALVAGQIDTFVGFNFIKSQKTPIVTATDVRSNFAWVKSSMAYCSSQEPRGFADILPQKRHSMQLRYEIDAGSTRLDEKGVVRILTDET